MGKLIEANKLMDALKGRISTWDLLEVEKILDEQPEAYNIDEVVEKLERQEEIRFTERMIDFMGEEISEGKRYVYIKNERTGTSTTRKLVMVGECVGIKNNVIMQRLYCDEKTYFERENVVDKVHVKDVICEWKPTQEQWRVEVE